MVAHPPERAPAEPISLVTLAARSRPITRLPTPLTSLIGREREVAAVGHLVREPAVRLVTLIGPGGVGKTRLALRVGEMVAEDFPDGVWFVPLASIRDANLVVAAIAQAVGVREGGRHPLLEGLATSLASQDALLILDNFEHLLEAAPVVADLLSLCPQLICLVTSRAVLRVSGEHAFPVQPLPLPPTADTTTAESTALSPAVRLFIARAQAAQPNFALSDANAVDVEAICRRLDGLPLALELAAARVRHLTPAELASRLSAPESGPTLRLLAGGPRDAPDRQQALRHTIAWSHDLLEPAEQVLFRRLAVFVGGFTLEAAEAVALPDADIAGDIADGIAALVDQSLLQREDEQVGEPRYTMLETVREFAAERLVESGEEQPVRDAHATWYLELAEAAASRLWGPEQAAWLDRMEDEHANLRAALGWHLSIGAAEEAVCLAAAVYPLWYRRGYAWEGRRWLEAVLAPAAPVSPARARALFAAGALAALMGDDAAAVAYGEASLAAARTLCDTRAIGHALLGLATTAKWQHRFAEAAALAEEALAVFRALGDASWTAMALSNLGDAVAELGDPARAAALAEEAVNVGRAVGDVWRVALALGTAADAASRRGEVAEATACYAEALTLWQQLGDVRGIAGSLGGLAGVALAGGQPTVAARLLGAAVALGQATGVVRLAHQGQADRAAAAAAAELGLAAFTAAWEVGRTLSMEQAVAEAHKVLADAVPPPTRPPAAVATSPHLAIAGLTPRELEVLRLLVAGCSDREIAETLFISPRTASKHVGNILAKLEVTSRGEAAVFAVRHHLV